MDEMTFVRELRAEAPTPSEATLRELRKRLTTRSRRPAWLPSLPRTAGRMALAGALAAVVATGVLATRDGGVDSQQPSGPKVVLPADGYVNAAAFLERAARTVEERPVRRPRPGQWIYRALLIPVDEGNEEDSPTHLEKQEEWWRFDSGAMNLLQDGKLTPGPADANNRTPEQFYDYLDSLPTDPQALRERIYRDASSRPASQGPDERAFGEASGIFRDALAVPSKHQAALYRVLASIPGVQVNQQGRDAIGRSAIAVTRTSGEGWLRTELLLEPGTYRYLGIRDVAIRDHEEKMTWNSSFKASAGEVVHAEYALETAVVDRPGERS
ncbi:CU044_5270 family protein [Actinomadura alba]|uniref:CU044_5270 family protein n=1 Tax=Actinomadura alba TaxID=406431 RepID=A0ABR7LWL9_9ACTN|nr:CU044_5270 family protein [Actinomadura alba]MBC6469250.1 CU044_5270 family protein [Actinomadura alba]